MCIKIGESLQENLEFYLTDEPPLRKPNCYDKRSLSEQNGYHGDIEDQYTEVICKTSFGLRKNAAYAIQHSKLKVSVYDKLMRHWIRTELGVDIPGLREVMEKSCWGCGEEKDDLKYCKG